MGKCPFQQRPIPKLNDQVFELLNSLSCGGYPSVEDAADSGIGDIPPDCPDPPVLNSPVKCQLPSQKSRLNLNPASQTCDPQLLFGDVAPFSQSESEFTPSFLVIQRLESSKL
jgi:hypothetical protein